MSNAIDNFESIVQHINNYFTQVENVLSSAQDKLTETINELAVEASQILKDMFVDYYTYPTEYYVRQGTNSAGISYGVNLYNAGIITTNARGIDIDYKNPNGLTGRTPMVYEIILAGERPMGRGATIPWKGNHVGIVSVSGSVDEAMDMFLDQFDNISYDIWSDKMGNLLEGVKWNG